MKDANPQGMPGESQTGHEETDIRPRTLFISAGALVATIFVCQVVLGLWMSRLEKKEDQAKALFPARQAIEVEQFPQPRLQESPTADMVDMIREEQARTTSYGWVDKEAGVAHIPVDRALEILAAKGLPKVAAPPPTEGAPPNTTIPEAQKRDEPGPEEDQPARKKPDEKSRPEGKRGGKS